jgi:hypothetical protein
MALTAQQHALVEKVLNNVDALDAEGSNLSASRERVYEHMKEALRQLILELPRELLFPLVTDQRADANVAVQSDTGQSTSLRIPVPTDFLRLLDLDLQTWLHPVREYQVLEAASEDYDDYLITRYEPKSGSPVAFWDYFENPNAVSWSGAQAFRVVPGDVSTAAVVTTGAVTAGSGVTVPVEALTSPAGVGALVTFSNGAGSVLTLTAAAAVGAASLVGDLDLDVGSGDNGTFFDAISRYLYVPITAPEATSVAYLQEPMLWLTASMAFRAIDPFIAEHAHREYLRAIGMRKRRNQRGVRRVYRRL